MAIGQHPQNRGVVFACHDPQTRIRSAAIAVDNASLGSFFDAPPEPSTRTRADSVAGTSSTVSPASTSCWPSR
jgi:hypothetical protein